MNKPLIKNSIFSLLIDPIFYVCSVLTILFTCGIFFFFNRFFVIQTSSSDLRTFWTAIIEISVLTIPVITFSLRNYIYDQSMPLSHFSRFLSLAMVIFTAAFIPVVPLLSVPFCVNLFGNVEAGQVLTSFLATAFCLFACSCFSLFVFSIPKKQNAISSLIVTVFILAVFNFVHLVPLYVKTGDFLTGVFQTVSFAWHIDSALKGILDSRDFVYFIECSFASVLLTVAFQNRSSGKKNPRLTSALLILIIFFSGSAFNRLYFRVDLTSTKQFSVSKTSASLCAMLEHPLRITYYRSSELKQFYPQTQDVEEYLKAYSLRNSNISLTFEKADDEKLSRLNIQGQQIKTQNSTKIEYITVYSAILLQYLDKSTIIPFVLSTQTLEYDLTQRVQSLVNHKQRNIFIIMANGMSLKEDYSYLEGWLSSRGFYPVEVGSENLNSFLLEFNADNVKESTLLVIGSANLSFENVQNLKKIVSLHVPVLFMTSPYTADIKNDWNISKNSNDSLIQYLNSLGFAFNYSIAEDLSNFPLTMQSGEGSNTEYKTVNYPMWINLMPQKYAFEGGTVFWASPIVCYDNVEPVLFTSEFAWQQTPSSDSKTPFIVNPFIIPKTAEASDARKEQLVLGAKKDNLALIADQFFVSSLGTGFISDSEQGDFRNFDIVTNLLLEINGEQDIAKLIKKSRVAKTLYKITSEQKLQSAVKTTIVINFLILPLIFILFGAVFNLVRYSRTKEAGHEKK